MSSTRDLDSGENSSPFGAAEHVALRSQLPLVEARKYFNGGFMGPMTKACLDAQHAMIDREMRDRVPRDWVEQLMALQAEVRSKVARLCNVTADQVALAHATHDAVSMAMWGLQWERGAAVVTTDEEHPGILIPLHILRDRFDIDVRMVAVGDGGSEFIDRVLEAADGASLIAVSHVSWKSGVVIHAADLPADVPVLLDGAQGAGAIPIDLAELGCDAYTVSAHKWPLGPNGCGALVLKDPEAWMPTFGGFFNVEDFADPLHSAWQTNGSRLEFAQEAMVPLAGWAASLGFLLDEVGVDRAAQHSAWLNRELREKIVDHPALTNFSGHAHLLSFGVPAGRAPEIATALAARGIDIRDLGPDMLRASLGFWNTLDEVDSLARELRSCL
jgi:L-cysteine/cystine lyase